MSSENRLYELIEAEFESREDKSGILEKLKNAPYMSDCEGAVEAYTSQVRPLQQLVRERVRELNLDIVEAQGTSHDYLFDTDQQEVLDEFSNWGLSRENHMFALFYNTGHMWVTVRSANFKSTYQRSPQETLDQMKEIRDKLNELSQPITEFIDSLMSYEKFVRYGLPFFEDEIIEANMTELKRVEELKEEVESKLYSIRKGTLSLSFVNGLIHHLEESTDLARHHPGD